MVMKIFAASREMVKIGSSSKIFSNNATIPCDIWTIGKELIALFELSTWLAIFPDFFVSFQHYAAFRLQLLFSNNRNWVR